jgi:hypothetical protein
MFEERHTDAPSIRRAQDVANSERDRRLLSLEPPKLGNACIALCETQRGLGHLFSLRQFRAS